MHISWQLYYNPFSTQASNQYSKNMGHKPTDKNNKTKHACLHTLNQFPLVPTISTKKSMKKHIHTRLHSNVHEKVRVK